VKKNGDKDEKIAIKDSENKPNKDDFKISKEKSGGKKVEIEEGGE